MRYIAAACIDARERLGSSLAFALLAAGNGSLCCEEVNVQRAFESGSLPRM